MMHSGYPDVLHLLYNKGSLQPTLGYIGVMFAWNLSNRILDISRARETDT